MLNVSRLRAFAALVLLLTPALLIGALALSGTTTAVFAAPPTEPRTVEPTTTAAIARPQIVGGEPAEAGAVPWQVALLYGGGQFCGGTIVAANWIVTAAHCVEDGSAAGLQILAGSLALSPPDDGSQLRNVNLVIVHPNYNAQTTNNDIALLRLSTPLTFTANIQPLTLIDSATTVYAGTGAAALVSGWGRLASSGSSPNLLQQVIVPIVSQAECDASYPGDITSGMLCAGYMEGGRDSCQGDSGGPLAVPVGDGWRLAGIVSWGTGCAWPGYPGVYTRVSVYRSWVESKISSLAPTAGPSPTVAATATIAPTIPPTPTVPPTATPSPTPLPPTAVPQLELVQNGEFEEGPDSGWSEQSAHREDLIYSSALTSAALPYGGEYAALLGGLDEETAILSQALITGPYGGLLSFRYRLASEDVCVSNEAFWYDRALVTLEVLGPAQAGGSPASDPETVVRHQLCRATTMATWRQETLNLADYPHAIVKLGFSVTTDVSYVSSMYIDDVVYTPYTDRLFIPFAAR